MPDPADVYIGVDVGGTRVAAGLVNAACGETPFAKAKYRADSGIAGAAALCVARALL